MFKKNGLIYTSYFVFLKLVKNIFLCDCLLGTGGQYRSLLHLQPLVNISFGEIEQSRFSFFHWAGEHYRLHDLDLLLRILLLVRPNLKQKQSYTRISA